MHLANLIERLLSLKYHDEMIENSKNKNLSITDLKIVKIALNFIVKKIGKSIVERTESQLKGWFMKPNRSTRKKKIPTTKKGDYSYPAVIREIAPWANDSFYSWLPKIRILMGHKWFQVQVNLKYSTTVSF